MATQLETFLQEINDAFSRGDIGFFAENSTDDVRWEMVGDTFTEGKRALIESMQGLEDSAPPDITVENVITHGNRAAVLGTMKWADAAGVMKSYAFCDVYTMSGFKDPKIREVKSFVIEVNGQNGG
jgi:ketosteroid isomerase-like protein